MDWLRSYPRDRRQNVRTLLVHSSKSRLFCGISQCSGLVSAVFVFVLPISLRSSKATPFVFYRTPMTQLYDVSIPSSMNQLGIRSTVQLRRWRRWRDDAALPVTGCSGADILWLSSGWRQSQIPFGSFESATILSHLWKLFAISALSEYEHRYEPRIAPTISSSFGGPLSHSLLTTVFCSSLRLIWGNATLDAVSLHDLRRLLAVVNAGIVDWYDAGRRLIAC